jgi:hypothetical protein
MKMSRVLVVASCVLGASGFGSAQANSDGQQAQGRGGEVSWSFDAGSDDALQQSLAKSGDALKGSWRLVPGVTGQALEFDGYTTGITREGKNVPSLGDAFSVSAWVALNNYPWNWVPIIDQSEFQQVGFSLGIDAFGHVGLSASFDGVWKQVVSAEKLPLKKWVHVTGTFQRGTGITILIDGKPAGHLETTGSFWQAKNASLVIGRVRNPINSFPAWISHPQDLRPGRCNVAGSCDPGRRGSSADCERREASRGGDSVGCAARGSAGSGALWRNVCEPGLFSVVGSDEAAGTRVGRRGAL